MEKTSKFLIACKDTRKGEAYYRFLHISISSEVMLLTAEVSEATFLSSKKDAVRLMKSIGDKFLDHMNIKRENLVIIERQLILKEVK